MKRNGSNELEQLKHLGLKMQGAASENFALTDKKKMQHVREIIYTNQGHLSATVTPNFDFTEKMINNRWK